MEHINSQLDIENTFAGIDVKYNEPMSSHTSLRIGGNADIVMFPKSEEELSYIIKKCKTMNVVPIILGAGTNVLVPDEGIQGIVICLKNCLDGIKKIDETHVVSMAGVTMTRLAMFAAKNGLGGLEFAHGIPGTVGGGIYMNAGAYGGEIGNICTAIWVMNLDGEIIKFDSHELNFSYRYSSFQDKNYIIVKAEFELQPKDIDTIYQDMQTLKNKRRESQPLNYPSAGSAFKRPPNGYAAALIEAAGLKGYRVGDAAISEKHAGFVVNLGHATANDIKVLLNYVKNVVHSTSGVELEPEIRFL